MCGVQTRIRQDSNLQPDEHLNLNQTAFQFASNTWEGCATDRIYVDRAAKCVLLWGQPLSQHILI